MMLLPQAAAIETAREFPGFVSRPRQSDKSNNARIEAADSRYFNTSPLFAFSIILSQVGHLKKRISSWPAGP